MTEWTTEQSSESTTIEIRVPAQLEQLVMLRALAETVALIADFGLDEVTDIRLALDEIATELILGAVADTTIDCRFTYRESAMLVQVSSVAVADVVPGQDSFGWHIVRTLTDTVNAAQAPLDTASGGYPTVVDFRWVRGGSDGR
ncbi:ATP-binding protein [Nocardia sp. KC 131]|uniref:ATP-binding protein n=1 Tax=Nocardia arseniciresistens TaxID=3392119 RepID=UPI00398F7E33